MKKAVQNRTSGNAICVVETARKLAQAHSQHNSIPQQANTSRLWVLCINIHPFFRQIESICWTVPAIKSLSSFVSPVVLTKYFTGILLWA